MTEAQPAPIVGRVEGAEAGELGTRWYHTIELGEGVVTPGLMDLRRVPARILPANLAGRRALDVATCDGFWAFELEARGAEVVTIDVPSVDALDISPNRRELLAPRLAAFDQDLGSRFELARRALGSKLTSVRSSVYELTPESIGGAVDLAFVGALLLHLRDPVGALERVMRALVPGGELIVFEPVSLRDTLRSPRRAVAHLQTRTTDWNWWYPNLATLKAWLYSAGFEDVRSRGPYRPPAVGGKRQWHFALHARSPQAAG